MSTASVVTIRGHICKNRVGTVPNLLKQMSTASVVTIRGPICKNRVGTVPNLLKQMSTASVVTIRGPICKNRVTCRFRGAGNVSETSLACARGRGMSRRRHLHVPRCGECLGDVTCMFPGWGAGPEDITCRRPRWGDMVRSRLGANPLKVFLRGGHHLQVPTRGMSRGTRGHCSCRGRLPQRHPWGQQSIA